MYEKMTFSALKTTFRIVKVIFSSLKVTFRNVKVIFSPLKVTFSRRPGHEHQFFSNKILPFKKRIGCFFL